jgi:hypothetical protein
MATWARFADHEHDIAVLGERIFSKYGIAYIGTVRQDGSPRVTPVTPVIIDGHLYLGLMPDSPKKRDVDRDERCVIHGLPGPNDAEISVRGVARPLDSAEVETLFAKAPPSIRLAEDACMYELDIVQVNYTKFEQPDVAGGRPKATRNRWVAPGLQQPEE